MEKKINTFNFEKIPYFGPSENLIDYFLIIGYEDSLYKDIKNNIQILVNDQNLLEGNLYDYEFSKDVSVINCISNTRRKNFINEEFFIQYTFIKKPLIKYGLIINNISIKEQSIIFKIKEDVGSETYHCFSYVFYETITEDNYVMYIPKCFTMVSRYPLFSTFNKLSKIIKDEFKSTCIPLEIQLFNIINFVPCPINSSYEYYLFPKYNIKSKKEKSINACNYFSYNQEKVKNQSKKINRTKPRISVNPKKIILNQLNAYPTIDIRIMEIFKFFTAEEIIELLIISFFEINTIYFSKDQEILNAFMYSLSLLLFPCDSSSYFKDIYSLNINDLDSLQRPNSIISGINCEYNNELDLSRINKNHFIVDLDNKNILFEACNNNKEVDCINNIINFINKCCNLTKNTGLTYLETIIFDFSEKLKNYNKSVSQNFKQKNIFDKKPNFFGPENELEKSFQNDCYSFILDLLNIYYKSYSGNFELDNDKKKYKLKSIEKKYDKDRDIEYSFIELFKLSCVKAFFF